VRTHRPTGTLDRTAAEAPDAAAPLAAAPPGEAYYRHPGDVLRLVLWAVGAVVVALLIQVAQASTAGVTTDLARAAGHVALALRALALALAQVGAVAVPVALAVLLLALRRFRRLGFVMLAAAAGAGAMALVDLALDLPGRVPDAVSTGTWVASPRFPSLAYLAGAAAATAVGKPWLPRPWRRAADASLVGLAVVMALAGTSGGPELILALAVGSAAGCALLVVFGAPNRRPAPAAIAEALRLAGRSVSDLELVRAEGGRSQLYRAGAGAERPTFLKVYGRDARDADLLYRSYRVLLLRGPNDDWPALALRQDVEHQALLLMLARQGGARVPAVELLTSLADGSMILGLEDIDGERLDALPPDAVDDRLLQAVWREVQALHDTRMAHRSLRAANVLVAAGRPVLIDLGFGHESAGPRAQAIDRAELLASLAAIVGPDRAVASAARVLEPAALAAAAPFLQPLALSAATRRQSSTAELAGLREAVGEATGEEPPPLERLVRVRPRTLVMIAALTGAFYVLLPQLANVGDSFQALRQATWGWLVLAVALSLLTYVASAVGLSGGVPEHLPFVPTVESQMASSFVNRVTPANVGGMALNVRFLQKAGVDPAEAVTGVGLNALAGGVVHAVLLVLFVAWAGQSGAGTFKIPSSSKVLVAVAVALALAGIVAATRKGRRLLRTHVWGFVTRSATSIAVLARSPLKLAALFGGSFGVTLAYIGALAAAVAAYDGGVSIAQVGAVYLGASVVAAAAPTPGGLGALEAALVAGFTGVGMPSGTAVAAVLSYRLATYWLPVLPGWACFHLLEGRGQI
jgi:glycosyltransferase 2 family protein